MNIMQRKRLVSRELVELAARQPEEFAALSERHYQGRIEAIAGEILASLGAIDYWFTVPSHRVHKTVHHYLLRATGGELTTENDPDHEAVDVAWLPLREAHRHLTFPNERRIAREAWQRLAGDD